MNLNVGLSRDSIDAAVKALRAYQKDVSAKTLAGVRAIAEDTAESARQAVPVRTGELQSSIRVEPYGATGRAVAARSDHAAFVEFGTGVVGSRSPYPYEYPTAWPYDVNQHGDAGWVYQEDGEYHWTRGMPSRPYMAPAALRMRQVAVSDMKAAFR